MPSPHVRFSPLETTVVREPRFFLRLDSPVVEAPSIGPRTSERLQLIGILQVHQLIQRDAEEIARLLNRRDVTAEVVTAWQHQATLVCEIPELRGHDAQVLVACGFTGVDHLLACTPQQLFQRVGPFVKSREGQRLLRSAKTPDLQEVTDWLTQARSVLRVKAA